MIKRVIDDQKKKKLKIKLNFMASTNNKENPGTRCSSGKIKPYSFRLGIYTCKQGKSR